MTGRLLHIHAGLPKTGTTAMQAFLARNRAALEAAGLVLPETGRSVAGDHHALFQALGGPVPGMRRRAAATLSRELNARSGIAFVSSEYALLGAVYGWGAQGFAALRAEGLRLRFHLVLRDPAAFAVSAHPEFLRNLLLPQPFEPFLRRQVLPLVGCRAALAARLADFGDVVLLDYDGGPVWPALLGAAGVDPPPAARDPGLVNPSLGSAGTQALLSTLKTYAPRIRRWNARMHLRGHVMEATRSFPADDGTYAPLTPDLLRLVGEQTDWRGSETPGSMPAEPPDPALVATCRDILSDVMERQLAVLERRKPTVRRLAGGVLDRVADRIISRKVLGP